MAWLSALGRMAFVIALAAVIGGLYGYPLQAIILALLAIILFWQAQMNRVQTWLQDPEQVPPDVYGIWGELSARIYLHQRNHKKVQKRLEASLDHLHDSFSSMRDGVIMVDDQGVIEWSNQSVEPLLGLRHPEDTGQTLTNLVREPVFNEYFIAGDFSHPLQFVTIANSSLHLRIEVTHFGKGERLLFVRDVSEAVRMEQMRRDFVANVSHELRTPLTVITGYLDTFKSNVDQLPQPFVKPVAQMGQQAQRMENLLKDLLWLSRIESEKREAKREQVDVGALLREIAEEVGTAYPDCQLDLDIDTDIAILGDYQELYSAASNLVNNAIKYAGDSGLVKVSWSRNQAGALLAVEDNGPGIDQVHIPRLTERFYRVDNSRSTQTGGTGLGLAIVKHVAQAHGAHLTITSELGSGTSFTLAFPSGG